MNFEMSIDKELDFLVKKNLTIGESYLLKMIILSKEDNLRSNEILDKYLSMPSDLRGSLCNQLHSLQDKGYILKSFKIPEMNTQAAAGKVIQAVPLRVDFLKNWEKNSTTLGEELFNAYPEYGYINGAEVYLRTRGASNSFIELEDMFYAYAEAINHNQETHNHIISLINKTKFTEPAYFNMALGTFIRDRRWLDLESKCNRGELESNIDML